MPVLKKIYSENDAYQLIEALNHNREKRNKLNGFLFEGVRNINNAIAYGWKIISFFYSKDKEMSDWARDILKSSKAQVHYELPFDLLKKLSLKEDTSDCFALPRCQQMILRELRQIKICWLLFLIDQLAQGI